MPKVQLEWFFLNVGVVTPLRGFFAPPQNASAKKKVAVNYAKLSGTYFPWSNKIFGEKIVD